jgi:hypothetical protein
LANDTNSMSITDHELLALLPRAPAKRTTTEICERLARSGHTITARSVQRRLINLSANFPVVSDERSKPFGWSIEKDAPPSLGVISLQEAISLKMGQRYLSEALPVEIIDDLKPYFKLADTKLKESKLYQAWMDKVRIISPVQSLVKPPIGRNLLTACYGGVLKECRLQVSYQRESSEIKSYEVDPLAIVLRGPVTYLVVRFSKSTEPSLLALQRIKSAKVTDSPLFHSQPFDLDAFIYEGAFGFFPEGEETLKVYFFDNAAAHLQETPFALNQELKEVAPGEHVLTVRTQITQQLKWWLLGFGERARVDGPAFLRREFAGRLDAAAKRYK